MDHEKHRVLAMFGPERFAVGLAELREAIAAGPYRLGGCEVCGAENVSVSPTNKVADWSTVMQCTDIEACWDRRALPLEITIPASNEEA